MMGMTNGEIADHLNKSRHTINTQLVRVYKKIDARNRVEAINWMRRRKSDSKESVVFDVAKELAALLSTADIPDSTRLKIASIIDQASRMKEESSDPTNSMALQSA